MPSIVYRTIKGTQYAYSSESYWDPVKKAPRTKRKYLGKVNPETGEIERVYKARKEEFSESAQSASSSPEFEELMKEVQVLREQNASLTAKLLRLKEVFDSLS